MFEVWNTPLVPSTFFPISVMKHVIRETSVCPLGTVCTSELKNKRDFVPAQNTYCCSVQASRHHDKLQWNSIKFCSRGLNCWSRRTQPTIVKTKGFREHKCDEKTKMRVNKSNGKKIEGVIALEAAKCANYLIAINFSLLLYFSSRCSYSQRTSGVWTLEH